jgi:hypothetical protein
MLYQLSYPACHPALSPLYGLLENCYYCWVFLFYFKFSEKRWSGGARV